MMEIAFTVSSALLVVASTMQLAADFMMPSDNGDIIAHVAILCINTACLYFWARNIGES